MRSTDNGLGGLLAAQNALPLRITSPQVVGLTLRQRCIERGRVPDVSSSRARIAADTGTTKRRPSSINYGRKPPEYRLHGTPVPSTRNRGTNYPESTACYKRPSPQLASCRWREIEAILHICPPILRPQMSCIRIGPTGTLLMIYRMREFALQWRN